jgi:DNA uptake protein ComE-like DNA-binding protein
MQFNGRRFSFNRSNRIGMLYFASIIIIIFLLQFTYSYLSNEHDDDKWFTSDETAKLQDELDSLKNIQQKKKDTIYPFNPNFLTDYRGYKLGLSVEEIDRFLNFREEDQWVNSAQDFQQITQISDSLLEQITPYFKFPDWVKDHEKEKQNPKSDIIWRPKKDLNSITVKQLQEIKGIGPALSNRIVDYRKRLKNFRSLIQLKDVWGLNYKVKDRLRKNLFVNQDFEQIDINKATVIELSEIPYFDYELSRKIFQFIQVRQGINAFEELGKLQDFPFDKIDRIKLYLKINN